MSHGKTFNTARLIHRKAQLYRLLISLLSQIWRLYYRIPVPLPGSHLPVEIPSSPVLCWEDFSDERRSLGDPSEDYSYGITDKGCLMLVAYKVKPSHITLGDYFLQINRWHFGTSGIESMYLT